jgi:hypothetical protein
VEFDKVLEMYCYSVDDLKNDISKNKKLIMVFSKFRQDMANKRKKERMMTMGARESEFEFYYNRVDMWVNTYIKPKANYWEMIMKIGTYGKSLMGNNINELAEVSLMRDNYTVNPRVMGNMNITDEFGEETKLTFVKDDPPDLLAFSKILTENKLLKPMKLMTDRKAEVNLTNEERSSQFDVDEFNLHLSSSVSISKLANLLATSEFKKAMMDTLEEEESDEDFSMVESRKESPVIKGLEEIPKGKMKEKDVSDTGTVSWAEEMMEYDTEEVKPIFSILEAVLRAFDKGDEVTETSLEESTGSTTMLRMLSSMMDKSVKTSLYISRIEVQRTYKTLKDRNRKDAFHNMLMWEIDKSTKYSMTDEVLLLAYNSVVKMLPFVTEVANSNSLVRFKNKAEGKFEYTNPMVLPMESVKDTGGKLDFFL